MSHTNRYRVCDAARPSFTGIRWIERRSSLATISRVRSSVPPRLVIEYVASSSPGEVSGWYGWPWLTAGSTPYPPRRSMRWVRKSLTGTTEDTIWRHVDSDGWLYSATIRRVIESPRITSQDEDVSDSVTRRELSNCPPNDSRRMTRLKSSSNRRGLLPVKST